jgi:hypothetical protein
MVCRAFKYSLVAAMLLASPRLALAQEPVSTPVPGTVIVEWTTESEVNLAGFNIYRSESRDGPYVRLNDTLIPASPDPIAGASYSYADSTARAGVTYYYKLEDVELDGKATVHGPITVVAQGESPVQASPAVLASAILLAALLGAAALWVTRRRGPHRTP